MFPYSLKATLGPRESRQEPRSYLLLRPLTNGLAARRTAEHRPIWLGPHVRKAILSVR